MRIFSSIIIIPLSACVVLLQTELRSQSSISYIPLHTNETFESYKPNSTKHIGVTPANAGVINGAASYTIPIYAPPGTNGMKPEISVNYNSQSGNGILGMGWSLGGLSVITLVNKNIHFDGEVKPIELNNNDRFALDGQRLIAKGGVYGAHNTKYGKEIEDFSEIKSVGQSNGQPDWFQVWTKDGKIYEYGRGFNSKMKGSNGVNSDKTISWYLSKVIDGNGNYIEYHYDNSYSKIHLMEVKYTGNQNTGLQPYNRIKFEYKIRDDINITYTAGQSTQMSYLLWQIKTYAAYSRVKTYKFKYGFKQGNSYLSNLYEYGADGETSIDRINQTIFKYGENSLTFDVDYVNFVGVNTSNSQGSDLFSADFNGDGYSDILASRYRYNQFRKENENIEIYSRTSTSNVFNKKYNINLINDQIVNNENLYHHFYTSDYSGDGRDDIYIAEYNSSTNNRISNWDYYRSSSTANSIQFNKSYKRLPNGFYYFSTRSWSGENGYFYPADYDGDGSTDYLNVLSNGTAYRLFFSSPRQHSYNHRISNVEHGQYLNGLWHFSDYRIPMDFKGDGSQDILIVKGFDMNIYSIDKNGSSYEANEILPYNGGYPTRWHIILLGDFNGDGKTDLLTRASLTDDNAQWEIALSDGKTFQTSKFSFVKPPRTWYRYGSKQERVPLTLSDFNGDGRTDICHAHYGGEHFDIYYSKGKGKFERERISSNDYNSISPKFSSGDHNGDGIADLAHLRHYSAPYEIYYFNKESKSRYLEKTKNGHGLVNIWRMEPLTKTRLNGSAFYERSSYGHYPALNVQVPINVVQESLTSNGIGGYRRKRYTYKNAILNKEGKGFLGFNAVTTLDYDLNAKSVNNYNLPLNHDDILLHTSEFKYSLTSGEFLSASFYTTDILNLGNQRFWLKQTKTENHNYLENRKQSTYFETYDNYGNVTRRKDFVRSDNSILEEISTNVKYPILGQQFNAPFPSKPILIERQNRRFSNSYDYYAEKTKYDYYADGNLKEKIVNYQKPKQHKTVYHYDDFGNINQKISLADGTSRYSKFKYDNHGQFLEWSENSLGQRSYYEWDKRWGLKTKDTNIGGLTARYYYDGFGKLYRTHDVDRNISAYQNHKWKINNTDRSVYLVENINPGAPNSEVTYDFFDRKLEVRQETYNNKWIVGQYRYNKIGKIHSKTSPYRIGDIFNTTTYFYDRYNRLEKEENDFFGLTKYDYSYATGTGELSTTIIAPDGKQSTNVTDASGKLIKATDNGGSVTYTYYAHGGQRKVLDGGLSLLEYKYDDQARLSEMKDVNAGTIKYQYNARGELIQQINANGEIHSMLYDNLGRITRKNRPDGNIYFRYYGSNSGAKTNMLKYEYVSSPFNMKYYYYDNLGRLNRERVYVDSKSYNTYYNYDQYDNITDINYPSGFGLHYNYDNKGFLESIQDKNRTVTLFENLEMNAYDQLTKYRLGNGRMSTHNYRHGIPNYQFTASTLYYKTNWDYSNGNLKSRRINNYSGVYKTEYFDYDNLDRLDRSYGSGALTINTNYSSDGNITFKSDIGDYTYGSSKINAVTNVENQQSVIPNRRQDISYTSYHQPERISENSLVYDFLYGPDEQRLKMTKKRNGTTELTRYYFSGFEKNVQSGAFAPTFVHYVSAGDHLVGIVTSTASNEQYYYTYTDHLGTILKVTDSNSSTVAEQNYDAWGRKRSPTTWSYNNVPNVPSWLYRGFTAHEHLPEIGLINMNGRLYDPALGRMLSVDNYTHEGVGLTTQAYNRYSYALNNPLKYTDPDGEEPISIGLTIAIGAAIGAGSYTASVAMSDGGFQNWNWGGFILSTSLGAASAAGASAIGGYVAGLSVGKGASFAIQTGMHAGFGGFMSLMGGGDFWSGAASGGISSAVSALTGGIGRDGSLLNSGVTIAAGGVSGGLSSFATGGEFWPGMRQGLITSGLNHVAHRAAQGPGPDHRARMIEAEKLSMNTNMSMDEAYLFLLNIEGDAALNAAMFVGPMLTPGFHDDYIWIANAARSSGAGKYLFNNWHKGTFANRTQSVSYHLAKHGKGRTATQYTQDAMNFFNKNKGLGQNVILKDGTQGIKIQTKQIINGKTHRVGGYWTRDGKLVTFWD